MKKKIEWSEAELAEIIKSVDSEVNKVIAKKEEDKKESEEKDEEKDEDEEKEESEEEKKKKEEDKDMDKSEEQQIEDLYSSMEKTEAESHYNCLKKVLFGKVSEEQAESVQKSESKENEEIELIKSENEKVKTENETLKKNAEAYEKVIEVLKRKVSAPIQKAVTGLDYIKKSDTEAKEGEEKSLSKSEIDSKLSQVIKSDISSSDREKINQYYLGKGMFETIKHLVK